MLRRPALYRPTASGWSRPYQGVTGMAVFYNGDPTPPAPGAPGTPPPAPGPTPPAPGGTYTQDDLNRVAAREKDQGHRAGAREALEKFAKDNGFASAEDAKAFIDTARKAREDQLSEQEKREQQIAAREQQVAAKEAAAAKLATDAARRMVLIRLGATAPAKDDDVDNLADAEALLRAALADDADQAAVETAANALKARRPELFGTAAAPAAPQAPVAPGTLPAPGMPRPGTGGAKPGDAGREMLRRRGKAPATT